jgi:hypothetical protein
MLATPSTSPMRSRLLEQSSSRHSLSTLSEQPSLPLQALCLPRASDFDSSLGHASLRACPPPARVAACGPSSIACDQAPRRRVAMAGPACPVGSLLRWLASCVLWTRSDGGQPDLVDDDQIQWKAAMAGQVQLSPSPSLFPSSSLSLFPLPLCRSTGSGTLEQVDLGDATMGDGRGGSWRRRLQNLELLFLFFSSAGGRCNASASENTIFAGGLRWSF